MKSILCFGDSNTFGLIPGTVMRYAWGVRWTSILAEQMQDWGYRVIEEGLCGRTTVFDDQTRIGRRGTELLPVLLESHKPIDVVVLMLGTNDCKSAYHATPKEIGEGIEQLIDQVQIANPDIQILLLSPITLGEGVWEDGFDMEFDQNSKQVSEQLPAVYKGIADKRGIAYLAASDYAKPSEEDREHLDADGHRVLAGAIGKKLDDMIREHTPDRKLQHYQGIAS